MKTARIATALTLLSAFCFAIPAADGRPVSDPANPHNLSFGATHGRTQATVADKPGAKEICIFCHTPHSASKQGALWNRNDPGLMGSFPLYNSASLLIKDIPEAQYNSTADYPNGASKLCLSCHDGVTGIGTLLDRTLTVNHATMTDVPTTATFDPVIDLELTHPVSFVYSTTVQQAIVAGGRAGFKIPSPDLRDGQQRVQCTTCHDPHDDRGEAIYNTAGVPPFWRHISATPANSYADLCKYCHGPIVTSDTHHTTGFPR